VKKAVLCAVLVILSCAFVLGQAQYKVLYRFLGAPSDGYAPMGNLLLDPAGNLYGTTTEGGRFDSGTIYQLSPNPDGTWAESVLYNFCSLGSNTDCPDGLFPMAGLLRDSAGNLYGTTYAGGNQLCPYDVGGCGTVFELSPPTSTGGVWTETVLYNFCSTQASGVCIDGGFPLSRLTRDGAGNLYGTTFFGGTGAIGGDSGRLGGTVFELSLNGGGWAETVLYNFCSLGQGQFCPDGEYPQAGVTFDRSGNLYGTTSEGGDATSVGGGTVYELSRGTAGWTETVIYASVSPFSYGANPLSEVTFDNAGSLYGTAAAGGPGGLSGNGSVFKLARAGGTGRATTFDGTDGAYPASGVLLDAKSSTLYGTTERGGTGNYGVIFKIGPHGESTTIYNFCSDPNCADGSSPEAGLITDKFGSIYGTAELGGQVQGGPGGVVFELTP